MRTFGLRAGLWIAGLIGLLVVPPLAFVAPAAAALALGGIALAVAGLAALLLRRRAGALAAAQDKLSAEIDLLSRRLLKVEAVAAALARAGEPPAPPASPAADGTETLAAEIGVVTQEIGLLSGIVRELAAVVSAQEGEIARLKAAPPAPGREAPPPRLSPEDTTPAPPPAPVAPSARAASVTPHPAAFRPPVLKAPADGFDEAALVAAFDGDGLEVWLQPVVSLPQRKVVAYAALARLRFGTDVLEPDRFLPVLERHGRTTALDRRMLAKVATIARHLQERGSAAYVAYSLSRLSLYEPGFLRGLDRLVSGEADLSGRLVIALSQASWRRLDSEQRAALAALKGRIGFALDRPADLRFDTAALAACGVRQVRIPAELLLRPPPQDALPDIAVEDLVALLGRAGLRLVATEVGREADVPDLIDRDVPLAQGDVFASPRAVRAEVLTAAPAQAAPADDPDGPAPEPPPQRRPFRDFLRRAV